MENEVNHVLRIGDEAPAFKAMTTEGGINFPEDFDGKWVILFSHPSDFTPVCTSELLTFGHLACDFEALNCQLIGLSVDSLPSHMAWLLTMKEKLNYKGMSNVEFHFPLIADLSMSIAKTYGMLHPGESSTQAVRAVFFIDPHGTIRAIIYYPMALGRNFDEIKRVLIGLQTIDKFEVALPADWHPGDEVIVPSPQSMDEMDKKIKCTEEDVNCYEWFFCTKPLSQDKIAKALKK